MRGKVCWNWSRWSVDGITPAYAGKRYIFKGLLCGFKDHPRLCGEKSFEQFRTFCVKGSPPPMRGKGLDSPPLNSTLRITPAYAGKRTAKSFWRSSGRDHPRLCGEKFADNRYIYIEIGSPPPMRGKVDQKQLSVDANRITPAYAGKSHQLHHTIP